MPSHTDGNEHWKAFCSKNGGSEPEEFAGEFRYQLEAWGVTSFTVTEKQLQEMLEDAEADERGGEFNEPDHLRLEKEKKVNFDYKGCSSPDLPGAFIQAAKEQGFSEADIAVMQDELNHAHDPEQINHLIKVRCVPIP